LLSGGYQKIKVRVARWRDFSGSRAGWAGSVAPFELEGALRLLPGASRLGFLEVVKVDAPHGEAGD